MGSWRPVNNPPHILFPVCRDREGSRFIKN
jgi:hypothetical protein